MGGPAQVVFAPDGDRAYVTLDEQSEVAVIDTAAGRVVGRIDLNGSLRTPGGDRVIPDGMKLDSRGNLYVTANHALGIFVYAPDATLLGHIGVGENPANLAWGDDDFQTMFVTAQTSVYRLRMKVPGQAIRLH